MTLVRQVTWVHIYPLKPFKLLYGKWPLWRLERRTVSKKLPCKLFYNLYVYILLIIWFCMCHFRNSERITYMNKNVSIYFVVSTLFALHTVYWKHISFFRKIRHKCLFSFHKFSALFVFKQEIAMSNERQNFQNHLFS